MTQDKVQLLGFWSSPYVLRVKWALSLKRVEYEYIEEDASNKSLMLLQCNPVHKKVPVLVHNGKPIVESLVILECIDEIWTNYPLLPQDPFEKARSRFWAKFVDDQCVPMVYRMLRCTPDQKEKAAKEAREILKTLQGCLNSNETSGGKSLGYMDIAFAWLGIYMEMLEIILDVKLLDEENTPFSNKWFHDVLDVQVIKECLPPFNKLLARCIDYHARHMAAKA